MAGRAVEEDYTFLHRERRGQVLWRIERSRSRDRSTTEGDAEVPSQDSIETVPVYCCNTCGRELSHSRNWREYLGYEGRLLCRPCILWDRICRILRGWPESGRVMDVVVRQLIGLENSLQVFSASCDEVRGEWLRRMSMEGTRLKGGRLPA